MPVLSYLFVMTRWSGRARLLLGCAFGAMVVLASSCLEPTQITVVVSTDVDCAVVTKTQTEIAIGTRASVDQGTGQNVTATTCAGTEIGSIALVPSGTNESVAVGVYLSTKLGKPSYSCRANAADCIVARRVIGYVPHTPLTLPIHLSLSCLNVTCSSGQTCVDGRCTSDTIDTTRCAGGVCGPTALNPPGDAGGLDATTDAACGDTSTDPKNCGQCGFDCSGGECNGGICRLVTKAAMPDDFAELGCLAFLSSTNQIAWTRTVAGNRGIHRVTTTGGTSTPYVVGPVGAGISANDTVMAFTIATGGGTLYQCDPSKPFASCQARSDPGLKGGSRWVATNPDQPSAYALYPDRVFAMSGSDIITLAAIGPMTGMLNQTVALQRSQSGPQLFVGTTSASSGFGVGSISGMVGDWTGPRVYFTQSNAIAKVEVTALSTLISNLPSQPNQLTIDRSANPNLYWTATEGNTDVVYRAAASGAPPVTKLYAFGLPIQCITAGPDALYWLSAGVPYKGHK